MKRLKQHYELLRIKPGAKPDVIKQAYLLAVQNLHDDRLADDPLVRHKAQERLRKINEAYMEIMDSYQEVQASLREGSIHDEPDRSAGMQTGSAPAKTAGVDAKGASRERKSTVIPKEAAQSGDMPRTVAAAGKQHGDGVPGDAPFSAVVDKHDYGEKPAEELVASGNVLPDRDEADSSGPADLLRKESYLLYSVVALVVLVIVVTWIRTAQKNSHPDAAVKVPAPVETASPPGETSEPRETAPKSPGKQGTSASRPKPQPAAPDTVDVHVVLRDAEQGNAKAQALLGYMYMTGKGVQKDAAAAAKWFRTAAAQGNAQAEDWLGYLFETGTGVPRNFSEAVKWYRLAAEKGDADAQKNLGNMYASGKGIARDRHEAIKWWRKAATQGNAEAQRSLEILQED